MTMPRQSERMRAARSAAIASVSIFASLTCGANAFADAAADKPAADSAAPLTTNGEEIVVSANRRAQRSQDVAASITSANAQKIEALGIVRAEDLQKLAPGIAAIPNNGSATSAFSIRGISQSDASEHEEQPVAIYDDGVYIPIAAATGFPLFDTDHVEILRGPQGTLFGRNATGGSVQFFSKQPTAGFAAGGSVTIGDYQTHRVEAYVNVGNDVISDRLAGYINDHDGYVKNLDGPNLLSEKVWGIRNQTKFQLGADTTAVLRIESWQSNGTSQNYSVPATTGTNPDGSPADHLLPPGSGDLYGFVQPSTNKYVESVNDAGMILKRVTTVSLNLEHQMGDIKLFSSSSVQSNRVHYREDSDGTPLNEIWYDDGGKATVFGQEIRASKEHGRLRWTTGASLYAIKVSWYVDFGQPTFCNPNVTTTCEEVSYGSGTLLSNSGQGAYLSTRYSNNYKSYGVFGQAEYDFTDKLTAVLGGRYSWDRQTFHYGFDCTETLSGACLAIFGTPAGTSGTVGPGGANLAPVSNLAQNYGMWSGKAQLNYKFAPEVLGYLSFNKGTKSGGYYDATAGNEPASALSFKPETLYAAEVGLKSQLFDNRLTFNIDYYHYDYKNSQQFNFVNGIYFTVVNLPAFANGVEVETSFKILPGLTANFGGSYNDFWVRDVQPCSTCALKDERAINSPKYIGVWGLTKTFSIADVAFNFNYSGRYTGDRFYTLINQPLVHAPAYVLQDVSLRADFSKQFWAQLSATNVFNKYYPTVIFDSAYQGLAVYHAGTPRILTATIGVKF